MEFKECTCGCARFHIYDDDNVCGIKCMKCGEVYFHNEVRNLTKAYAMRFIAEKGDHNVKKPK